MTRAAAHLVLSVGCWALIACSVKSEATSQAGVAGSGTGPTAGASNSGDPRDPVAGAGAGSGVMLEVDAGTVGEASGGVAGSGSQIISTLPAGYEPTDMGGYQLGEALSSAGSPGGGGARGGGGAPSTGGGAPTGTTNGNCGNVLRGVARDFPNLGDAGANPDFESPTFWGQTPTLNLVASTLGADKKPVYASKCELANTPIKTTACPYGAETTTRANFDQWYRDTPSVNQPFAISLYLAPQPGGLFTFQSLHYFPLDAAGFGNAGKADDGLIHNFGFTTEIHTQFSYSGGESFQFQGDDDVWVFINGKIAVDLGGLHPRMLGTIDLDASAAALGIQKGNVYSLDLFHAERHTDKSTFRIDTNLSFVNCGTVESGPK